MNMFSKWWSKRLHFPKITLSSLKYKCDILFLVFFFTFPKFIIPEKRSYISNTASNNSQNMFIIYVIDLSTKNKM